jgi:RNA polymerase sigma factor (sigma-70 family)
MRDGTTERGLVERAREGDHDAFALLIDRRLGSTIRSATAILGNEPDARDATQRIFVQAWRELPSLRDVDAFASWFRRIVVNTCRSALRERRRRRSARSPLRNWERRPNRWRDRNRGTRNARPSSTSSSVPSSASAGRNA